MYINKTIFCIYIAILIFACNNLSAQIPDKPSPPGIARKHSLVLYVGGGYSSYISPLNFKGTGVETNIVRTGPAATIRVLWQPQYRLRLGIETGFCNLYSYRLVNGNKKGRVSISAIPVMVVWSMSIVKRLDIFAGLGTYLLTSKLDYAGKVSSKLNSLGTSVALAYKIPISRTIAVAAHAKWMNAFQTKDALVSGEVGVVWNFFRWDGRKGK